jgi:hypothetical protein
MRNGFAFVGYFRIPMLAKSEERLFGPRRKKTFDDHHSAATIEDSGHSPAS